MDKENVQTRVQALQENVEAKHVELIDAQTELSKAKHELANAGKPKIQSKVVDDLVDALQDVFTEILHNVDTHDLNLEFGIDYSNQIVVEHIDFDNIGISGSDIYEALEDVFNIVEDDDNS